MEKLIYRLAAETVDALTPLLSVLPGKTGRFFAGRTRPQQREAWNHLRPGGIWIHAASAGEYEQAVPLIEYLRHRYPHMPLTVSFFSPSGYERFSGKIPAQTLYLPIDTPRNMRRFFDVLRPKAGIVMKYEFWPFMLEEAARRKWPLFSASAVFRPDQALWKHRFLKESLRAFEHFFVQDETSARVLQQQGFTNSTVTGDTRFDTVAALPARPVHFPVVESFKQNAKLLIAGSTWPEDEDKLLKIFRRLPPDWKLFVIPHEPSPRHIRRLRQRMPFSAALYSRFSPDSSDARILIGDTTGLLKFVYRYADAAYVGGGFGKGIHNLLEAAVYGVPVVFGPVHQKFNEARDLIVEGGGFAADSDQQLERIILNLATDERMRREAGRKAANYVRKNTGAAKKLMRVVEKYLS